MYMPHGDVIKWKHFPRYWPFVRGIHRRPVNSPHKGQWRGALMFFFICAWVNNRDDGDLRRHRANYDAIVMARSGQCCIVVLGGDKWIHMWYMPHIWVIIHQSCETNSRSHDIALALCLHRWDLWVSTPNDWVHHNDAIMSAMASQITGVSIVCSTVGSRTDQRKHQNSVSLDFVQGIHRSPVNSPH